MNESKAKYLPEKVRITKASLDALGRIERQICLALIAEGDLILVENTPREGTVTLPSQGESN